MYFHVIISMYFHVFQCISCIKSSLTPDLCQVDDSVTDGDGTVVSDGDGTVGSVIDSDAMDGGEVVSGDGLQVWTSDIVEICWDQWSQCEKKISILQHVICDGDVYVLCLFGEAQGGVVDADHDLLGIDTVPSDLESGTIAGEGWMGQYGLL